MVAAVLARRCAAWRRPCPCERRSRPGVLPHAHLGGGAQRRAAGAARAGAVALGRLDRRFFTAVWACRSPSRCWTSAPLQLLWCVPGGHGARAAACRPQPAACCWSRAPSWSRGRSPAGGWWSCAGRRRAGAGGRCVNAPIGLARRASLVAVRGRGAGGGGAAAGNGRGAPGPPARAPRYPPRVCRRACCCSTAAADLAEEGVGFGVPVLKRGVAAVFAGGVDAMCRRGRCHLRSRSLRDGPRRAAGRRRDGRVAPRRCTRPRTRWPRCTGGSRAAAASSRRRPARCATLRLAERLRARRRRGRVPVTSAWIASAATVRARRPRGAAP